MPSCVFTSKRIHSPRSSRLPVNKAVPDFRGKRGRYQQAYQRARSPQSALEVLHADVVVIGGGVIGLCTAYSLLRNTRKADLKVVLIERNESIPATANGSGAATGAGQGYIWLAHRDPHSAVWPLAVQSKQMWQDWLCEGTPSESDVEWQASGSILLGTDAAQLADRQRLLESAGIHAELWDAGHLHAEEPALAPSVTSGLFVSSDSQLNGRAAAKALLGACEAEPGFSLLLSQEVERFQLCPDSGKVQAINTADYRVMVGKAAIVAAGAWSGDLVMAAAAPCSPATDWQAAIRPRKGHLLELPAGVAPRVTHGLMEIEYAKHYAPAAGAPGSAQLDVTFTATASASGALLLGSSREFAGFDGRMNSAVAAAILARAARFLPALAGLDEEEVGARVGLRPYAGRGAPYIGPVPGAPGVYIAAGHEGSGLTLGPATGELLAAMILGHQDPGSRLAELARPFAVH